MTLLDWIARRFGYMKAETFPRWLLQTAAAQKFSIPSGSMWESQAELYQRLSWVHIVVSAIAKSCATTKFEVKKMVGEKTESIVNHEFELLLQRPNPLMSRFEFIEATIAYRSLTGNSYWWLNRTSENEKPQELWIIPSHMIKPVPDQRMYLKGYMYDPGDGREIPIESWQVVHFKEFHPLSPFVGLSPIEAIATIAVGDLKMQDWNTRLFAESNARLPGILAFADPIADPEWDKIKEDAREKSVRRELMMLRNAGKGGVEWIQAVASQKDMEFLDGRKFTKEEIFNIYAPGFASMTDVNATEANALAGKATFRETTIHPLLVSVAEKVTNNILEAYGEKLKGEFEDVRLTDRALELKEQEEYAKTHTIDEVRAKFYESEPLGDDRGKMLIAQIDAAPVSMGDEEAEEEAPIPAPDIFMRPGSTSEAEEEEGPVEEKQKAELGKWQRKAERKFQQSGSAYCTFESDVLPLKLRAKVMSLLGEAKTAYDVQVIFDTIKADIKNYGDFTELIRALDEATTALRNSS